MTAPSVSSINRILRNATKAQFKRRPNDENDDVDVEDELSPHMENQETHGSPRYVDLFLMIIVLVF